MYTGSSAGLKHFFICSSDSAIPYITHNGIVEEDRGLWHTPNTLTKAVIVSVGFQTTQDQVHLPKEIDFTNVLIVYIDSALCCVVESIQKP